MKRNDVMSSISISHQLAITRALIYRTNFFSTDIRTSVVLWGWNKKPARWLAKRRFASTKWRPALVQVPHCQLAGLEQRSSPLHRMYAFLLVKSNDVISTSGSQHPQDLLWPPGPFSTWLTVTEIALRSDFWLHHHRTIPSSVTYTLIWSQVNK
jgi:hypothetical protein